MKETETKQQERNAALLSSDAAVIRCLPYLEKIQKEGISLQTGDEPFLSILIRTQGKRYESLKDVLLCLSAQTDRNFEILLIAHKATEEGLATLDRLLAEQTPELLQRLHRIELNTGTRSAPLNAGIKAMKGQYFAMLDDDDLVTDDWVANFHRGADLHNGRVIRCYGVAQEWKVIRRPDGSELLCSGNVIKKQYCKPFRLTKQLEDNYTPISCAAIPAIAPRVFGLYFDESLNTAEDWDMIMRCIMLLGVYDTECTTFIYRLWDNMENSHTLHSTEEWLKNRKTITDKFDNLPIITDRTTLLQERKSAVKSLFLSNNEDADQALIVKIMQSLQPTPPLNLRIVASQTAKILKQWLQLKLRGKKYVATIKSSSLFDEDWYKKTYPDVRKSGIDPAKHYLLFGWAEYRNPSEKFDTLRYLEQNPDVFAIKMCPLLHYELTGKNEGRMI